MPYTSRHDASLRTKVAYAVRGIREDIPNYIRERERERERDRERLQNYLVLPNNLC